MKIFKFTLNSLIVSILLLLFNSCFSSNSTTNVADPGKLEIFLKNVKLGMPMDEVLAVLNWRIGHGQFDHLTQGFWPMPPLPGTHLTSGLERKTGAILIGKQGLKETRLAMIFYKFDGEWLIGDAYVFTKDPNALGWEDKKEQIFNKDEISPQVGLPFEFEKLLISKVGTPKQKMLVRNVTNGEISAQQFLVEHHRLFVPTGSHLKYGHGSTQTRIVSPNPTSKSITSGLSYEDAKKQTIKRFMNKEITRDECLKLLMDLKVQYGK